MIEGKARFFRSDRSMKGWNDHGSELEEKMTRVRGGRSRIEGKARFFRADRSMKGWNDHGSELEEKMTM